MSNLTYVRTRIRNHKHLIEALENLGYVVSQDTKSNISCFNKQTGQTMVLQSDIGGDYAIIDSVSRNDVSNSISEEIIKIENRIKREYARTLVKEKLTQQGFFLVNESENNDMITIKLSRVL